jgi:TRAP-type C4-dicarboxylate transport system permease small subunit
MRRIIDGISVFLGIVAGLLLFYLILGIGIDVTLRGVTGRGISAIAEYADIVLVALVYLSLARTQMDGGHIASSLVAARLPTRVRVSAELAGMILVVIILASVTWYATSVAITSYQRGEYRLGLTAALIWPARWAIVVGLIAWQLQLLLRISELVQGLRRGTDPSDSRTATEAML